MFSSKHLLMSTNHQIQQRLMWISIVLQIFMFPRWWINLCNLCSNPVGHPFMASISTKLHGNPSNSCFLSDPKMWTSWWHQMKSQGITEVIRIHPLGTFVPNFMVISPTIVEVLLTDQHSHEESRSRSVTFSKTHYKDKEGLYKKNRWEQKGRDYGVHW